MRQKLKPVLFISLLAVGSLVALTSVYVVLARTGQFQLSRDELISSYADPDSRFVQVNGIDIHYKDEGQGPVVLLLHGSFGSLRTWDGVVSELKGPFRLIRMDQPPSALSGDIPADAIDLTLEDFIGQFLDEIGVERASLVGTSSGGIIAYRFAAKYPNRVNALVISNSPSAVVDNSAIVRSASLDSMILLSTRLLQYKPKLYWRMLLESLYADPSRLTTDTVAQYFDFGRKARTGVLPASMFARVNDNTEIDGVLGAVSAPTLLLWGVPDPVLPEDMAYQLESKLSSAPTELVFLRGTGHYPPVESPLLVAQHVERFLSSREKVAPHTLDSGDID